MKSVKRIFDYFGALVLFVLLLPLFLSTCLMLYFFNKKNVFFFQERPGLKGKVFKIYKFKTMTDEKGNDGELLPDDKRLTPIGKLVRKLSLDEIPQLINVIKGEMSFIGPRPLLVEYLPLYNDTQKKRHDVLPGITGWAQVNGRNAISWEKKFELDVYYVENWSLRLDFKIIFMTIKKVLAGSDVSAQGVATATKFEGTKKGQK